MGYEERSAKGGEGGRKLINILAAGWGNIHFMQCRHKQGGLKQGTQKSRNERGEGGATMKKCKSLWRQ